MNDEFISLITSVLQIPADALTVDSTTETVPEWTSLSHWEIIDALENHYGVEFTMDEATEFENLGELYEMLLKKLSQSDY
jgi:acyl carrier protein